MNPAIDVIISMSPSRCPDTVEFRDKKKIEAKSATIEICCVTTNESNNTREYE